MSCKTRTELETAVDAAFSDLIDNTALQCEQVDHEQKHGLWAMGGMITISYNSTTGENELSWRDTTGMYKTVNPGTLDFNPSSGNATSIRVFYPAEFATDLVQQAFPVAVQATMVPNLIIGTATADGGFKVSANPTDGYIDISLSRYIPATGLLTYTSASGGWVFEGVSPYPSNALSGSMVGYSNASGQGIITITRPHRGLPKLIPVFNENNTAGDQFTPVLYSYNGSAIQIKMWNEVTGAFHTGGIEDGWRFGVDYGFYDDLINHLTTNLGTDVHINLSGLFQTLPRP
jgi:hypothetical protein